MILDKSGSMQLVKEKTIEGFNTFLDEQKKVPGEATISLVQFDTKVEKTYLAKPQDVQFSKKDRVNNSKVNS